MATVDGERSLDVAQLAHVEILTPKPEETLAFFTDLIALQESARAGRSVYLRAFEDTHHHTLKITEAPAPGLGHIGWRTRSAPALERRVAALTDAGVAGAWIEGDVGHGPAFRFETPDGHPLELMWEIEPYVAPPGQTTPLLNRPQRRPDHGVPARRIDHVNCYAADPAGTTAFFREQLGFMLTELILDDTHEHTIATWLTVSNRAHDIALFHDPTDGRGRLHHVCYFLGSPQNLNDLVELMREADVEIEAGPGIHGVTRGNYLYVFEPGGNRVELWGDAGLLVFDPAWEPVVWTPATGGLTYGGTWIGRDIPESFFARGTPDAALLGGI